MRGSGKKGERPLVIKREEVIQAAAHGGNWKIAYADFVTAMMAFFLLMWLIGATTDDQRRGIADYFAPSNVFSRSTSGSGKPFGGHTPFDPGSLVSDRGAQAVRLGSANATMDTEDPEVDRYRSDTPDPETPPVSISADKDPVAGAAKTAQKGPAQVKPAGADQDATTRTAEAQAALLANATVSPAAKPDVKAVDDATLRAELERREKEAFDKAAEQIRAAVRDDPALATLAR